MNQEEGKKIYTKYIMPTLNQCGYELKNKQITQVQKLHNILIKLAKNKPKILPQYKYREVNVTIDRLIEDDKFYLPEYIEDASDLNRRSIYDELYHKLSNLCADLKSDIRRQKDNNEVYKQEKEKYKKYNNIHRMLERKIKNSTQATMLVVENAEELIPMSECIHNLVEKKQWLEECTKFFDFITKHYICFDVECYDINHRMIEKDYSCCDYFLFNKKGEVKQFVAIGTLGLRSNWYESREKKFIIDNNIRAFRKWIESVYYLMAKKNQLYDRYKGYEHPINILYNSPYAYSGFDEVLEIISSQKYIKNEFKKIGIFMDGSNILYNLHPLDLDYHNLLQEIYGDSALNCIKVKICTIFKSTLDDICKQESTNRYIDNMKNHLEDEGFQVEIVENNQQKANQIDDQKLIQTIKAYQNKIDRVLIMTGDKHFIPIIKEYRDAGKEVCVISVGEENTSREIYELEGINHYYIAEFDNIVKLSSI